MRGSQAKRGGCVPCPRLARFTSASEIPPRGFFFRRRLASNRGQVERVVRGRDGPESYILGVSVPARYTRGISNCKALGHRAFGGDMIPAAKGVLGLML